MIFIIGRPKKKKKKKCFVQFECTLSDVRYRYQMSDVDIRHQI